MSRVSSEFDVTAVVSALNRECNNTVEEVDKAITEAGGAALDYLLNNSPVDTSKSGKLHVISKGKNKGSLTGGSGAYRKGWRIKTYTENGMKAVKVYNETCYQLTHLLEFGHLGRDGKRVAPKVHVAPVQDDLDRKLLGKIKTRISRGLS